MHLSGVWVGYTHAAKGEVCVCVCMSLSAAFLRLRQCWNPKASTAEKKITHKASLLMKQLYDSDNEQKIPKNWT